MTQITIAEFFTLDFAPQLCFVMSLFGYLANDLIRFIFSRVEKLIVRQYKAKLTKEIKTELGVVDVEIKKE